MGQRRIGRWAAAFAAAAMAASPARAKVAFTGYGDFQTSPQGWYRIDGPPSVLSSFGLGPERIESRGSQINALGLFATSTLDERTRVQMDVTYRDIGQNAKTVRVQYAYVDWSSDAANVQAGKITLPFGWYNQNHFYPFQRPSISGPVFVTGILGLPQSDVGADVNKTFPLGRWSVRGDIYAVNGYGPVPGSTSTFRNPGVPGGLTIANNIGSTAANHKVAVGARLDASHEALPNSSFGVSYYRHEWDTAGRNLFQMAGVHAHGQYAGYELIAEYLYLRTAGDEGMLANFNSRDWRTDGFFVKIDDKNPVVWGKKLTPWARFEDYVTRATYGGGGAREALWEAAAGAALQVNDNVALKVEADDLYYALPYAAGPLKLRGYTLLGGVTVTF